MFDMNIKIKKHIERNYSVNEFFNDNTFNDYDEITYRT